MKLRSFLLSLMTVAALSACMGYVQRADYAPMQDPGDDMRPAPVKLTNVTLRLPVGADVGFESNNKFCAWPFTPVGRKTVKKALNQEDTKEAFQEALEGQGYDVVRTINIDFDPEDEEHRTEYMVAAHVTDLQLKMCHNDPDVIMMFFSSRRGIQGELFMNVEWSVYDALTRQVVYKTSTEGYTNRKIPNQEGLELMLADAFGMASHNFGADQKLHDLLFSGKPTGYSARSDEDAGNDDPGRRIFDPAETVTLPPTPISTAPFESHIKQDRNAVVIVESDLKGGSGIFLTPYGHILTAAHNVGNATLVRIISADRKEKMKAEVLRVNKARDVALLKLTKIPKNFKIVTLPMRTTWPAVSDPVFYLGAGRTEKMDDTLTRGIVSAHRKNYKISGSALALDYIEGNIAVDFGKGGGPLLDAQGNVVGLGVEGFDSESKRSNGLNMFIPLDQALQTLNITPSQ